ncbi:hypothetical protein NP233_g6348 [Leucocoprinus birnbaumii]|uniref:G domain-containing protein n=1 Tax=Leucocoprinus birnbaumii TaxID=56174 RepID=A0AAD5VTG8_9AGAR|nr:hypothetical protein NP233_g6348 [Leucocoprinus birnbaumii]
MPGTVINATKGVKKDDIIIAFMGPTGSGKSFFIDLLTGQPELRAGHSLASVTAGIEAVRMPIPTIPGRDIVLVDTPGFDDTTRSDMEILTMISDWLKNTYKQDVKLSGLIYLHRITDNRMAGSPHKNLRMFGELCGDLMMTQVVLVTTMWGKVAQDIGLAREKELKAQFWKNLIDRGSEADRLESDTFKGAWSVVNKVVERRLKKDASEIVLLQEELVDNGINLNETAAGKALYTDLQKRLAEQREAMASLLAQVQKSDDQHLIRQLRKEHERIEKEFKKTFEESKQLKLPSLKKIAAIFPGGKKTKAKPVKITGS